MLDNVDLTKLTEPFSKEAFTVDSSRGFPLVGVKVAYVVDRLNKVFGIAGLGWRYHAITRKADLFPSKEIVAHIVFQYRVGEGGSPPYSLTNPETNTLIPMAGPSVWSEPPIATGGGRIGSGGTKEADAQKSAISAALSKAASKIGIAQDAYMGRISAATLEIERQPDEYSGLDAVLDLFSVAPEAIDKMENSGLGGVAVKSLRDDIVLPRLRELAKETGMADDVVEYMNAICGEVQPSEWSFNAMAFIGGLMLSVADGVISKDEVVSAVEKWNLSATWQEVVDEITSNQS